MLLEELFDTYEKLKENIYIINRGDKKPLVIKFKNDQFFHLVGLHKTNIRLFIPNYITSKDKIYKYMKKNIKKYNNILLSEIKDSELLTHRLETFKQILDLLTGNQTSLYRLKPQKYGSLYDGDFGLLKIYQSFNCLLGLVISEEELNKVLCAPQSWMASNRVNQLISGKRPIYMNNITKVPISEYHNKFVEITN